MSRYSRRTRDRLPDKILIILNFIFPVTSPGSGKSANPLKTLNTCADARQEEYACHHPDTLVTDGQVITVDHPDIALRRCLRGRQGCRGYQGVASMAHLTACPSPDAPDRHGNQHDPRQLTTPIPSQSMQVISTGDSFSVRPCRPEQAGNGTVPIMCQKNDMFWQCSACWGSLCHFQSH